MICLTALQGTCSLFFHFLKFSALQEIYPSLPFFAEHARLFHKSESEAVEIMEKVHKTGSGIAGIYSYDIALTKSKMVIENARRNGFPLRVEVEVA